MYDVHIMYVRVNVLSKIEMIRVSGRLFRGIAMFFHSCPPYAVIIRLSICIVPNLRTSISPLTLYQCL